MSTADQTDEQRLDEVQRETFNYFIFIREINPANGMVADGNQPGQPVSIAAIGLTLTAYPIGIERGSITRVEAIRRILATLEFFQNSPHSEAPDATGYKGFYYNFLNMNTGRRA